ncbi:MAG TPA: hypothetical protein VMI34_16965 [Candidatus Bathyarchaeia archaeon]|nr:hypothetical protein [Candidatus Bathyarchaeia archaeon]
MDIRLAARADLPAVQALLEALYVDNLSETERAQGFLSVRFTVEDLAQMVAEAGIVIARDAARIAGAVCSSPWRPGQWSGVLGAMSRQIEVTAFEGRPLASRRLIVFGPAAMAPAYRGRHVLRQLFEALRRHAAGRWDIGVVFVAHSNPHSMGSSQALGMRRIADFENEGRGYALLVFPIPPAAAGT